MQPLHDAPTQGRDDVPEPRRARRAFPFISVSSVGAEASSFVVGRELYKRWEQPRDPISGVRVDRRRAAEETDRGDGAGSAGSPVHPLRLSGSSVQQYPSLNETDLARKRR